MEEAGEQEAEVWVAVKRALGMKLKSAFILSFVNLCAERISCKAKSTAKACTSGNPVSADIIKSS